MRGLCVFFAGTVAPPFRNLCNARICVVVSLGFVNEISPDPALSDPTPISAVRRSTVMRDASVFATPPYHFFAKPVGIVSVYSRRNIENVLVPSDVESFIGIAFTPVRTRLLISFCIGGPSIYTFTRIKNPTRLTASSATHASSPAEGAASDVAHTSLANHKIA